MPFTFKRVVKFQEPESNAWKLTEKLPEPPSKPDEPETGFYVTYDTEPFFVRDHVEYYGEKHSYTYTDILFPQGKLQDLIRDVLRYHSDELGSSKTEPLEVCLGIHIRQVVDTNDKFTSGEGKNAPSIRPSA
jgi:hypothetical protein